MVLHRLRHHFYDLLLFLLRVARRTGLVLAGVFSVDMNFVSADMTMDRLTMVKFLTGWERALFCIDPAIEVPFNFYHRNTNVRRVHVTRVMHDRNGPSPLILQRAFQRFARRVLRVARTATSTLFNVNAVHGTRTLHNVFNWRRRTTRAHQ